MTGRDDHNIYNPLPSFFQGDMGGSKLQKMKDEAIEYVCDLRFHRSFTLPPNPQKGRHNPLRVTYADAGYHGPEPGDEDEVEGETPVMLYIGGMFAGRYQALTVDAMAKEHKIRILFVDRPGIGGTQKVPLDQRVPTWLDLLPALLRHVGVQYVALGSHSAGTIYLMNTLLHLRHVLHPRKPYVAFFAPWVHPSSSGETTSVVANMLPNQMIGSFHYLAKFAVVGVGPVISFSGGMLGALSATLSSPFRKAQTECHPGLAQEQENKAWEKVAEGLMTKYLFAEGCEGAGQEALLCLKKGNKLWGEWENYDKVVPILARNEAERVSSRSNEGSDGAEKLLVHVLFASYDERIGRKGKEFFESCWSEAMRGEYIDYEGIVFPDTNHDGVCNPDNGCFGQFFEEIAKVRKSRSGRIVLESGAG